MGWFLDQGSGTPSRRALLHPGGCSSRCGVPRDAGGAGLGADLQLPAPLAAATDGPRPPARLTPAIPRQACGCLALAGRCRGFISRPSRRTPFDIRQQVCIETKRYSPQRGLSTRDLGQCARQCPLGGEVPVSQVTWTGNGPDRRSRSSTRATRIDSVQARLGTHGRGRQTVARNGLSRIFPQPRGRDDQQWTMGSLDELRDTAPPGHIPGRMAIR